MANSLFDILRAGQMQVESGGNPNAISPAGAQGLYQIMPATARDPGYGVAPLRGWDGVNPMSAAPEEQARFNSDYMQALMQLNPSKGMTGALQSYNAGPGRMAKVWNGQSPMPQETAAYADKVYAAAGLSPDQFVQTTPMSGNISIDEAAQRFPQRDAGLAAQLLASRFQQAEPNINDWSKAAIQTMNTGKYVDQGDIASSRLASELEQLKTMSEYQKNMAMGNYYQNGGSGANSVKPVYNPETGQMEYVQTGQLAGSGYMPAAPTGKKYTPDGRLIPSQPSPRDQMAMDKSRTSANAAYAIENMGNEAKSILSKYNTGKAAKIRGETSAWWQVGSDDPTPEEIVHYQRLDSLSKDMGTIALQQFGGNDTDKELQIAIQTNLDLTKVTEANLQSIYRKLAAAKVLQQRPVFEEEWVAKTGGITMPDPETGETFSSAWMKIQRELYNQTLAEQGIGGAGSVPNAVAQGASDLSGMSDADLLKALSGGD